ncbi:hypothetical protein [Kribbella sp.]|uniref:hypothetical protein n=1 Tax=Kribbella sp. TaxID=1871183 RepID=UPI002D269B23|nr:hypothetical protein [Kribbella sp.]HZX08481.1 hypothetical protein [Kribbella sp.]
MSKFLGFLLGVAVALAGPAVFGVLAAPGGIALNTKEMALAFGIGALLFWAVVSYFSGAGALGAFVAFGTLVYCWLWIPNRTTNFLNGVPGVSTGMIDGSKQYTLNGVVPILGVISLVYSVQLIVRSVQRRRRERVEAERLQREQEAAQAQQEADVAAVYPVAGGTYQEPAPYQSHSSYDDLFDDPEPVQPRNQADEQTRQFPAGDAEGYEQTRQFPAPDADSNQSDEETVVAPTPAQPAAPAAQEPAEPAASAAEQATGGQGDEPTQVAEVKQAGAQEPVEGPATKQEQAEEPVAEQVPVANQEPVAKQEPVVKEEPAAAEETKAEEAKTQESKAAGEQKAVAAKVTPKEQMGSQYRERMEDPEDTGEFFLAAFEKPAVKPA